MIVEPFSFLRLPLAAAVEHKWNALGAIRDPGADVVHFPLLGKTTHLQDGS